MMTTAAGNDARHPRGNTDMTTDWTKLVADLERLLKLRSIPFGMKLFEHREEMEAIPDPPAESRAHARSDRRPGRAPRLDRGHDQRRSRRRAVPGGRRARPRQGREWRSGSTWGRVVQPPDDASAHQAAMECVPDGRYRSGGGGAAGVGPARPARHRAVLRDAGGDDLFHQRPAMGRLQALRLERGRRSRPAPIAGAGR